MQVNWPTTGAAGVVAAGMVAAGIATGGMVVEPVVVESVVVVAADVVAGDVVSDKVEDVGPAVEVGGEMLGVGVGVVVSAADPLADDSTRVVHPAASSPIVSTDVTADVTIDVRWPPTNGRDPTKTVCPRSTLAARRFTTSPGPLQRRAPRTV